MAELKGYMLAAAVFLGILNLWIFSGAESPRGSPNSPGHGSRGGLKTKIEETVRKLEELQRVQSPTPLQPSHAPLAATASPVPAVSITPQSAPVEVPPAAPSPMPSSAPSHTLPAPAPPSPSPSQASQRDAVRPSMVPEDAVRGSDFPAEWATLPAGPGRNRHILFPGSRPPKDFEMKWYRLMLQEDGGSRAVSIEEAGKNLDKVVAIEVETRRKNIDPITPGAKVFTYPPSIPDESGLTADDDVLIYMWKPCWIDVGSENHPEIGEGTDCLAEDECVFSCPIKCRFTTKAEKSREADVIFSRFTDTNDAPDITSRAEYKDPPPLFLPYIDDALSGGGSAGNFVPKFQTPLWIRRFDGLIWHRVHSDAPNQAFGPWFLKPILEMHGKAPPTFNTKPDQHITFLANNCRDSSDRPGYLGQLKAAGLGIASFGTCFSTMPYPHDVPKGAKGKMILLNRYKFHFTAENSIEDDWVTEKIWQALLADTVPVYYGTRTLKEYLLPKALLSGVVFADEFESPQELAEYIKYLDNNDSQYQKLFEWRRVVKEADFDHLMPVSSLNTLCNLCLFTADARKNPEKHLKKVKKVAFKDGLVPMEPEDQAYKTPFQAAVSTPRVDWGGWGWIQGQSKTVIPE